MNCYQNVLVRVVHFQQMLSNVFKLVHTYTYKH